MGGIGLWNDVADPNDTIFDCDHGTLTQVTSAASVTLIVPPPGCKKLQLDTQIFPLLPLLWQPLRRRGMTSVTARIGGA